MVSEDADREEGRADEKNGGRDPEVGVDREPDHEPEPVHEETGERLGDLDAALEDVDYPATAATLVDAVGDYEVETRDGRHVVADVLDDHEQKLYESSDDVRERIQGLIHRG